MKMIIMIIHILKSRDLYHGQNDSNKTMVTILVIGKLQLFFKFNNKKTLMGKLKF